MSATATFEVDGQVSTIEVRRRLGEIWRGEHCDVLAGNAPTTLNVQLAYFTHRPDEMTELRSAAAYLLSISREGRLYYWRDWDAYAFDDNDYPGAVSLDALVTPEFAPAMHDGVHYRYIVA